VADTLHGRGAGPAVPVGIPTFVGPGTTAAAGSVALTDAVASGGDLASLVTALREREARIREMRARPGTIEVPAPSTATMRDLERRLRARLHGWRGLLRRQTAQARPLLGRLLDGRLVFTPHEPQRLYTFTGRASLGELISGAVPSLAMVTPGGFDGRWNAEVRGIVRRRVA
jgi:hypothetical protein